MKLVLVEYMPVHLRATHKAAGNAGFFPYNGSERFLMEENDAKLLVESEPDWASILNVKASCKDFEVKNLQDL